MKNTCNEEEGSINPEQQPTLVAGQKPIEKSQLKRIEPYLLLDAWRGIAALWVVMVHSCDAYVSSGHLDLLRNPIYKVSLWGRLGVVMFFVISGYCISGAAYSCIRSGKSIGRYAIDRLRRIYPPYLVACVTALAFGIFTLLLQRQHILPSSNHPRGLPFADYRFWLANLTLTQAPCRVVPILLVAWSLCYEVVFYVMVGFFMALGKLGNAINLDLRFTVLIYAGIITTMASLLWLLFSPANCPFPLNRWYQFGFGSLLFAMISHGGWRSSGRFRIPTFVCLMLCLGYACFRASPIGVLGQTSPRAQALVCVCFFLALLLLHPYNERASRWKWLAPLMWLGTFSYSVYLVHLIFIGFVDAGMRKIGFNGSLYIIAYLLQLLAALGSGWVFYMLIERRFISTRQESRIAAELHPLGIAPRPQIVIEV